ncbi:hypothetical protein M405DRAFT_866273 [Rhizopogon salebrosus TDB-379]|nr:hypothetical protein M405DRAFT_866273 [Rhizopogon salebrosus TDB-379]
MESTTPILLLNLREYWDQAETTEPDWQPQLYSCGRYDPSMDAFPVVYHHKHIIHIPARDKPLLRFMNHMLYCAWILSRCIRLSDYSRRGYRHVAHYLDILRHQFFDEVLGRYYPTGTHVPVQVEPEPRMLPRSWRSSFLWSWAFQLHVLELLEPASEDAMQEALLEKPRIMPEEFGKSMSLSAIPDTNEAPDWQSWPVKSDPVLKAMYGRLPDEKTEYMDFQVALQEARQTSNSLSPLVETHPDSLRVCLHAYLDELERRQALAALSQLNELVPLSPSSPSNSSLVLPVQAATQLSKRPIPVELSSPPHTSKRLKVAEASDSKPTPRTSGSKPTPRASGSKPTPRASGSKPTPRASGSKPTPRASGSKPTQSGLPAYNLRAQTVQARPAYKGLDHSLVSGSERNTSTDLVDVLNETSRHANAQWNRSTPNPQHPGNIKSPLASASETQIHPLAISPSSGPSKELQLTDILNPEILEELAASSAASWKTYGEDTRLAQGTDIASLFENLRCPSQDVE